MKDFAPLAKYCRKLPKATEDVKWGKDLVFSIGEKMFACFNGEDHSTVAFKTSQETFTSLTEKDGVVPAPYLARHHWVQVTSPKVLPRDMLEELLRESYQIVADKLPRKVQRSLGLDE